MSTVRFPWWANPALLLMLSLLLVWYCTTAVTAEQFASWGMARYTSPADAWAVVCIIVAASFGLVTSTRLPRPNLSFLTESQRFLESSAAKRLMYVFAGLTVTGYIAWICVAIIKGVSLGDLVATVQGRPGAVAQLKLQVGTAAGVTTLTQFGPVTALLAVARWRLARRPAVGVLVAVLGLSLLRFVFYAERLALLEIAVPLIVFVTALFGDTGRWTLLWRRVVPFLPIVVGVAVLTLFALGEYLRTWSSVGEGSFVSYILDRFLAYYATATNNGVLYSRLAEANHLDQVTFYGLYHLPASPFGSGTVDGIDFDRWWETQLEAYGNPNLTNVGTVMPLIGELSLTVTLVLAFVTTLGVVTIHRAARQGHLAALLAVPVLCFAFLELPRISYLTLGRSAPILLGLVAIWFIYDLWCLRGTDETPHHPAEGRA